MQFTAEQIADLLEGEVDGDPQVLVNDLAKIEEARSGTLTFLANARYTEFIYTTKATIAIVNKDFAPARALPRTLTLIRVADARMAFTHLLERNHELQYEKKGFEQPSYVSPKARFGKDVYIGAFSYVGDNVQLGDGVKIFPNCYIGDNSTIGKGTRIHAGVKIYHQSQIGEHCVIHSGAVIGADGFGFSNTRQAARRHLRIDGPSIVVRTLQALADRGEVGREVVGQAFQKYRLDDVNSGASGEVGGDA